MPKITQLSQLDQNQTYSYADYLTWQFRETVELLKGKVMLISPAPNLQHQRISADINDMLYNFLSIINVNFLLHRLMFVYTIEKNLSWRIKKFILSFNPICASSVILKLWINKAVTVRPIGLLRFYPKGIPNWTYRSNLICIKKVACKNTGSFIQKIRPFTNLCWMKMNGINLTTCMRMMMLPRRNYSPTWLLI